LSDKVRHGIHAVAVDERRADFTPTLWDSDARITQVLFPGAHADVGGGYTRDGNESGLSDCSLAWMTSQLATRGVAFARTPRYVPSPLATGVGHRPWSHVPWTALLSHARSFPAGLHLAQCLIDRCRGGSIIGEPGTPPCAYMPGNLTAYLIGSDPAAGVIVI
jgi:hypothetical protein